MWWSYLYRKKFKQKIALQLEWEVNIPVANTKLSDVVTKYKPVEKAEDDAITQGKPRDKHKVEKGRTLPGKGEPKSSADLLNPDGSVKQRKYYGKDGRPEVDIDFNHTDNGTHTFPHRHIWDWNKVPPRQDSR